MMIKLLEPKLPKLIVSLVASLAVLLLSAATAHTATSAVSDEQAELGVTETLVREALQKKFSGARVEVLGAVRWQRGQAPETVDSVTLVSENSRGESSFTAKGHTGNAVRTAEGVLSYSSWSPVRIAKRRILPGEKLTEEFFSSQELNLALGNGYEYRGVVLPAETDLSRLETRQTIIEGQFLISSAVQKIPDIRRGDAVRVQLISGGLTLSTLGTAEEPGLIDQNVRVMTTSTKRSLAGRLRAGGIVEVNL